MNRETLLRYVSQQNLDNGYQVDEDGIECAVDIMEFVGGDLYRPLTRLLLSNWHEIAERIAAYTEEDWAVSHRIAEAMKREMADLHPDETQHLSDMGIAIFIEMLEGRDTYAQSHAGERPISEEKLRRIRSH